MKYSLLSLLILLEGCVTNFNPNNIIEVTDDQWIEDGKGRRCEVKEMLIFPDRLEYYLPDCGVVKVVHPKIHPIPDPKPVEILKN